MVRLNLRMRIFTKGSKMFIEDVKIIKDMSIKNLIKDLKNKVSFTMNCV